MTRNVKGLLLICVICLPLTLCGCKGEEQRAAEIDPADLTGVRVGVNLAWESDYVMTERGDADLYRYNSNAESLLALMYNNLDAIAIDAMGYKTMSQAVDGLELIEPAVGETGYMLYFRPGAEDLRDDFNVFLMEFKQTDEYSDFLKRCSEFDGKSYVGPETEPAGEGREITVAVDEAAFPRSYRDPGEDEPKGYDVEIVRRWAKASGCRIKWVNTNFDDLVAGLRSGMYDAGTGYLSDYYTKDAVNAGICPSDSFDPTPIYLVRRNGKINIKGDVD